jgi:hypothetical protein
MKIKMNVPRIHGLLASVLIVTFGILGSNMMQHQVTAQQITNNSSSTAPPISNNTSPPTSVSLPLSQGYVNGKIAFFIATDASDSHVAASITNTTGIRVNFAPNLGLAPVSARQQGYDFINGIKTSGSPMGFQLGIASALPGEKGYSPLFQLNFVKWNDNATPRILKSVAEVVTAETNGELTISKTDIVINSPAVIMPNR